MTRTERDIQRTMERLARFVPTRFECQCGECLLCLLVETIILLRELRAALKENSR